MPVSRCEGIATECSSGGRTSPAEPHTRDPRDRRERSGGVALNYIGVEDVLHAIARMLDPLLRLLWSSPPGRHRPPCARTLPVRPLPEPGPGPAPEPYLRGEDSPLVRPYFLAHERRQAEAEARRQRGRRRALWFAVHGVDLGPRVIHGREVAA